MRELQILDNVIKVDLKPKNILYDPETRTVVFINLKKNKFIYSPDNTKNYNIM